MGLLNFLKLSNCQICIFIWIIILPKISWGYSVSPSKTSITYRRIHYVVCKWSMGAPVKSDKNKLMIFEWNLLWRIFDPYRNWEAIYGGPRSIRELNTLFNEPDVIGILKSRKIRRITYGEQRTKTYGTVTKWWSDIVKQEGLGALAQQFLFFLTSETLLNVHFCCGTPILF